MVGPVGVPKPGNFLDFPSSALNMGVRHDLQERIPGVNLRHDLGLSVDSYLFWWILACFLVAFNYAYWCNNLVDNFMI